ncbi:protein kinase/lanthionine synthetase C family protein [Saccharopolyspora erythraea]|uniref:class IV lanthionine synthetase LanL n=1 Tax=Saccharopolyspora erythraea TaxID=1836 RepID=UPI001BA65C94|nr:class IV lanthionine synthetase LanL [Saccharopolyspora erythraea]QUH02580.1 protein kinase/lanthionine synthetase C family protein [Saccharopolyspora erythraea]
MEQESRPEAAGQEASELLTARPAADPGRPGPGPALSTPDPKDLVPLLRDALGARADASRWRVAEGEPWCMVSPSGAREVLQGWKLHVSATMGTAGAVLQRCLPVLLDAERPFKFAITLHHVYALNSGHAPRYGAGKFLTCYPGDDEQAVELAEALHLATTGLSGPVILSDRPYRPGSIVHYRYGSFANRRVLTNDGLYRHIISSPAGEPVPDLREPRYTPPEWARCPFPAAEPAPAPSSGDRRILLGDRFAVREAIRHANKGGLYRAQDLRTGKPVVIKEARPHTVVGSDGTCAQDMLRAEARALEALAPLGVTPEVVEFFEQSGHLYLAMRDLQGPPLRRWVTDRFRQHGPRGYLPAALRLAERLVDKLQAVHETGLVLRDFTPNNVIVVDDEPWLIDFELSVRAGDTTGRLSAGTPGYAAPEQLRGSEPDQSADRFSLGATLAYVLTGADPRLPEDEPAGRPLRERLSVWLPTVTATELPASVTALITGLMDDEPANRPAPSHARTVLAAAPGLGHRSSSVEPFDGDEWQEAVDGIVDHLLATMNPDDDDALWPVPRPVNDPCNVQHGAAGVLGALTSYYRLRGGGRVAEAIGTAAEWIRRRMRQDGFRPPGLYFGRAGIAWALHDAAAALRDHPAADDAVGLAKELPTSWLSPDITHGMAGIGLTYLHFWQVTGDAEFAHRVRQCAEALLRSMRHDSDGPFWQVPEDADSIFAGQRFHGFAHGTAGVGYFLLAAGELGGAACETTAEQLARPLLQHAVVDEAGARWHSGLDTAEPLLPHWCNGSSGVGTFLVRLARLTGDTRARGMAEKAASATVEHSRTGAVGQCHGLTGNAEFVLDMADFLEEPAYVATAHRMAHAVFGRRVYRDGRTVFTDPEGHVSAEWADGVSGVLAFLLRLRYGGPRRWMADAGGWTGQR